MNAGTSLTIPVSAPVFCTERALTLSDEDTLALKSVAPSDLRQWTLDRAHVYEAYLCTMRVLYNAAAPINQRLPPEILNHIFSSVFPDRLAEIRLMHVCHYWRTLLARTPEYWVDMLSIPTLWDIPDLTEAALRLSAPHPLMVRSAPAELYTAAWMRPHLARINDLRVAVDQTGFRQLFLLLRDGSFASVKSLRLVWVDYQIPSPPAYDETFDQCPDDSLPLLKHLSLSAIFYDPRLVVGSIEHMTLLASPDYYAGRVSTGTISLHDVLLHPLKRCVHGLLSFHLTTHPLLDSQWPHYPTPPSSIVNLPSLRELDINSFSAGHIETLLEGMVIPPFTVINIHCQRHVPQLCRSIPYHHAIVSAEELAISYGPSYIDTTVSSTGKDLLHVRAPVQHGGSNHVTFLCQMNAVTTLALSSSQGCLSDSVIPELLRRLPNLTRLVIHYPMDIARLRGHPTVRTLLERLNPVDSSPSLIRALDHLVIRKFDPLVLFDGCVSEQRNDLVSILEHRCASAGRPLKSLTLGIVPSNMDSSSSSADAELVARVKCAAEAHYAALVDEIIVAPYSEIDGDTQANVGLKN
ncbi:hypothetical protein BC628DRAFT_718792 [Trametes gibbosa]|nr:hypothetical protein BC628DRAFT_718792 [Trametes gibbosa]